MNNAEKQLFVKKLDSDSDDELAKTLHYYRSDADLELLPRILGLLVSDRSDAVKDCVVTLCGDIRDIDAANVVFDFMAQTHLPGMRCRLMQSLCLTGLDFAHNAERIVGILISTDDFEMAFEALSLLENCTESLSESVADTLHDAVSAAEMSAPESVRSLYKAAREYLLVKSRVNA
jgi:hypothetical protein